MEYQIINGGETTIDYTSQGTFSDVKITNKEVGAKSTYFTVKMDDGKNKKLYVQTPSLLVPKGIDIYKSPDGDEKFYLEVSMSTNNVDEDVANEINNFKKLAADYDAYNISQGIDNAASWIGKKGASEELVTDKYHPMLRYSKDEDNNINDQYPPSIRFRLYKDKDGNFTTTCYDKDKNLVDLEQAVQKGCRVKILYHQQSCWLNKNTGFGASNKLLQIKVFPSSKLNGYAFIDDGEDNEEDDTNGDGDGEVLQEDEDDALDNGVEAESVVEPEPAPKKKGGRKKKTSD